MAQPTIDQLTAEIAQLTAENAELTRALQRHRGSSSASSSRGAPRAARWLRGGVATTLILIGAILAPLAVVATWAHHQLTDTDYFVSTFAPLADDPAVQDFIADEAATAIESQIDLTQMVNTVFDDVTDLGLGPRAQDALNLLRAPVVSGLTGLVESTIHEFVRSDAFAAIWKDLLEISHTQLVNTATGQPDAAITIGQDQQLELELGPVIDAVKKELVANGIGFADRIPTVSRSIVIAENTSAGLFLTIYQIVVAVGLWLPWVMLAVFVAGVLIAPRRALALASASGAVLFTMVLTGAGIAVGTEAFALAVSPSIPHDAATVLYSGILGFVTNMLTALGVVAAMVFVVTLLAGPWRWAVMLRGKVLALLSEIRRGAAHRGITTGSFGTALYRWRQPVRVLIGAGCAAFILFVRPLSPGMIVWTGLLGVIAIILLELLARPEAEETPTPSLNSRIDSEAAHP